MTTSEKSKIASPAKLNPMDRRREYIIVNMWG